LCLTRRSEGRPCSRFSGIAAAPNRARRPLASPVAASCRRGGAGLLGLDLPTLLAAEAAEAAGNAGTPRAKSVIFLFLFGGPSQLETFDMK
jgi:hypothetical protein